jgi:hypothetical protein
MWSSLKRGPANLAPGTIGDLAGYQELRMNPPCPLAGAGLCPVPPDGARAGIRRSDHARFRDGDHGASCPRAAPEPHHNQLITGRCEAAVDTARVTDTSSSRRGIRR